MSMCRKKCLVHWKPVGHMWQFAEKLKEHRCEQPWYRDDAVAIGWRFTATFERG